MDNDKSIRIRGARQHNLCNLDLTIKRNTFTVITGVSGSGKSSLAFDTLYAEGYRKYIESLSAKARQLLAQMDRPEVDYIEGLSPVIAIEQHSGKGNNPRSTVASMTELADYGRIIWAVTGDPHCPLDGAPVVRMNIDDCVNRVFKEPEGTRIQILAPRLVAKTSVLRDEIDSLRQKGYSRIRVDGVIGELDDKKLLDRSKPEQTLELLVDRILLRSDQRGRIADSLELAFSEGGDKAVVLAQEGKDSSVREILLSQAHACSQCGEVYPTPSPRLFSWNHPDGACPTCDGMGEVMRFDPDILIPDPSLSVKKGAIKPWKLGSKKMIVKRNALLRQLAEQLPFDLGTPWADLSKEVRDLILFGSDSQEFWFKTGRGNSKPKLERFSGVMRELEGTVRTTSSDSLRARLMAYQNRSQCPDCKGERLNAYVRSITINELSYSSWLKLSVGKAHQWARNALQTAKHKVTHEAVNGLLSRLHFLKEVGLGYLTLDRPFQSLSGGEAQRCRLATQLGMGLVGVIYVLDEPSIGLHAVDNARLVKNLKSLRDKGNTVVVVEHDEETIESADELIELGPGAGTEGGELVFQGPPSEAIRSKVSRTGLYLSGKETLRGYYRPKSPGAKYLEILGAREHNLKNINVRLPVGLLTVICGVSGSGKSTLIHDILAKQAARKLHRSRQIPGVHREIKGWEHFDSVVRVDSSPIGKSPRSNPATYVGLFTLLRSLFSKTPLAKVRGYTPGRFSFNVAGGRCEKCKGDGMIRLDMQFMSDVYVECPSCRGKRYNRETLEVRYRGLNIAEVLDLTVEEARDHLSKQPAIRSKLDLLHAVGLGYLKLGQSATTLSGGESQRLKLATELSRKEQGRNLYLLDEPTTGLHWDDIARLIEILYRLRDAGNTILVIEHHLDIISLADWVVELGLEGGDAGGQLIYQGVPAGWGSAPQSPTCSALQRNSR